MLNNDQQKNQIQPVRRLDDPKEWNRILMVYGGIFKNQIKQYGETIAKKHKPQKNYSR